MDKPLILFRTDSGIKVGSGHLMRCLTLAHELRDRGCAIHFACRDAEGSLHDKVLQQGFALTLLPRGVGVPQQKYGLMHADFMAVSAAQDAMDFRSRAPVEDAAVVFIDHYGIDEDWETHLALSPHQVLAGIDDIADRKHVVDLLVDQNYYRDMPARYEGKVKRDTKMLLGPTYACIRRFFSEAAAHRKSDPNHLRILVSFGGADTSGYGLRVVEDLLRSPQAKKLKITLMGRYQDAMVDRIEALERNFAEQFSFAGYTDKPWDLMSSHDIYLGAGGTSTWERCAAGMAGVVYAISANQVEMSEDLDEAGYQYYLGKIDGYDGVKLVQLVEKMVSNDSWRAMAAKSQALVDGKGCERIADALMKMIKQ